jgi:RNA polymerase sigma-70 factor (ECF subfamily)
MKSPPRGGAQPPARSYPPEGGDPPPGARRLSPDTFAEALTANGRALWCIAAAIVGDRGDVEDVLQQGAIIALGKLDEFDADTSFIAWMGRIVRYEALNQARRRRKQKPADADPATIETTAGATDAARLTTDARGRLLADQTSFDDEVMSALRALEETPRACILLRTLLDLPYREISRALGIPEGTAMSHVHRARHVMRDRLRARAAGDVGSEDDNR